MKFLLFNAVVGAALIYLFLGNDWSLQGLRDLSLSNATKPALETAKIVSPKPNPKSPEPTPVRHAIPEPAPLPAAVAKRRAVVLARQVTKSPGNTPTVTGFMTRQERRQALLSMAEDMEVFSVEAIAR